MTRFTSPLGSRMEAFLELKRAMGRRYQTVEAELHRFDRYVASLHEPVEFMTRELVHEWLIAKPHVRPATQESRAGVLRQFCLYLVRLDPRTYVPDRALFPARRPVFKAHVYSHRHLPNTANSGWHCEGIVRTTASPGTCDPHPLRGAR